MTWVHFPFLRQISPKNLMSPWFSTEFPCWRFIPVMMRAVIMMAKWLVWGFIPVMMRAIIMFPFPWCWSIGVWTNRKLLPWAYEDLSTLSLSQTELSKEFDVTLVFRRISFWGFIPVMMRAMIMMVKWLVWGFIPRMMRAMIIIAYVPRLGTYASDDDESGDNESLLIINHY